jgi:predicted Zn-dependent peptidase
MVEESPEELVHDLFFELIYGNHALGRPILGTEASIRRIKRADVLRFFRKYYRPDQMIVSVSGDVAHVSVERQMRALLKRDWPGRPRLVGHGARGHKHSGSPAEQVLKTLKQAPPRIKSGSWWIDRPTEQVHLVWGVAGPPYASRDRFAAFLLNIYLGGGMSSSLFQEIREKNGLAYTVYSTLSPFIDSGVFSIYVATGMKQVPLCLKLIEECVTQLKRELLSDAELKTIKDNLKGSILLASDEVESRMSSIAKNELFFGRYVSPEEVCQLVDAVTPQDVRRMARKLLRTSDRTIVALGPRPTRKISESLKAFGKLKRL